MQYIELLAPAKNADYGITAINHGADAVYIAAQKFGAREAAGNSMSDIEQLVSYAHKYFAKVYLTLNTIIFENELEEARKTAIRAYETGCDALIVQDMALLEMDLPPIVLHASTQANNLTAERVKFLANVGFKRIVLGRELSMKEVAAIHQQTPVELEAFIHGALCVSHSGQCYLSAALTGRSANRGACAQPCRSAYDLFDANGKLLVKDKHLLSLRDFNLSSQLKDLYKAGVCSFKIEGRLKDISYLKNTTAHYRKLLDELIEKDTDVRKPSSGKVYMGFTPNPELSFSRGFTTYFAEGGKRKMASIHTPKSIGEKLGKVKAIGKNWFTIDTNVALNNGDGICFFTPQGKLEGVKVNSFDKGKIFPLSLQGIAEGLEVYRSYNHAFEKLMLGDTAKRLVKADVYFYADASTITITATDEDGVSVSISEPQTAELAKNVELAAKNLADALSKSGGMFELTPHIAADGAYFYSHSTINAWRRTIADLLGQKRLQEYKRDEYKLVPNSIPYYEKSLSYLGNVANSLAQKFYKRHGVSLIDDAFELQPPKGEPLMFTHYCIRFELGMCTKGKQKGNAEPLLLYNNGKRIKVEFDCERCGMKLKLE